LTTNFKSQLKFQEKTLKTILDKTAKTSERLSEIRGYRNYNNHKHVSSLLVVLQDSTENTGLRITLAEALGWFTSSIKKDDIIAALTLVCSDVNSSSKLKDEAVQSIRRLKQD